MTNSEAVLDPGAGLRGLVIEGQRLLAVENETLRSIALQRPRDPKKCFERAMEELETVPELAATKFYSIPYADRRKGGTMMVEGPSIIAAMQLANLWGNCIDSAHYVAVDDERILVEGVFIDLEAGRMTKRQMSVSRTAKNKAGDYYLLGADRLNIAIQAGMSKAVRNAILRGLPESLVVRYTRRAKELAATGGGAKRKHRSTRIRDMVAAFDDLGVTESMLVEYLQHPSADTTSAELDSLRGLYNALKDNQISVNHVWGEGGVAKRPAGDIVEFQDLFPEDEEEGTQ